MSDLTSRLRITHASDCVYQSDYDYCTCGAKVRHEAADRIEELENGIQSATSVNFHGGDVYEAGKEQQFRIKTLEDALRENT